MRDGRHSPDSLAAVREYAEYHDPVAVRTDCVGEHGCRLALDLPTVCLSCDHSTLFANPQRARPDFLIAAQVEQAVTWVIVEMTIGSKSASDVQRQIQAGIDAITHSELLPLRSVARVAVTMRRRDKQVASLQRLAEPRYWVLIAGRRRRVRERFCGDTISSAIVPRRGE